MALERWKLSLYRRRYKNQPMKTYKLAVNRINYGIAIWPKNFWFHFWTPAWSNGRGPYISIGIFIIAFFRGY